ncbi:MAG: gliding motility protein GldN [Reichenbachiella sp.]
MKRFCYVLALTALFSFSNELSAQEMTDGFNPDSVYPVHESYKMFKRVVWRRIDMKEKQNAPFFSRNGELSTIIIKAVKAGLLFPYETDSVNARMSKEVFLENLKLDEGGGGLTDEEIAMGFGADEEDDFFGGDDSFSSDGEAEEELPPSNEYATRDFSLGEIKEEVYFDRMRSRMYYDIQAFTIILPADKNPALFEKPLASFKFKDLVALFRSMPEEAIWYNAQNSSEHRNMADAFNLRLFSSTLTKYGNPGDNRIVDIYGANIDGIIASKRIEYEMIDFENELWEF